MRVRRNTVPVLVVDPDPRTARLIQEVTLTSAGPGETVAVTTMAEALAALRRQRPAAVVTELVLPDGDGLSLIGQARDLYRHLPAVVLTAEPTAQTAARAVRQRVDDYLNKHTDPVSMLHGALREAMRVHAHEAEVKRLISEMAGLNDSFVEAMERLERQNQELADRLTPPAQQEGAWQILVVDDEPHTVAVLEALLRSQAQYEVDGANSAAEARALFARKRYDVVLTDKNLGDDSGVELIREVQAAHPGTKVLLMTGFATVESAADAMRYGAVAYLRKPFADLQEVLDRIEEVVGRITRERDESRYLHGFRQRNAAFLARYRLIKTKLMTVQEGR